MVHAVVQPFHECTAKATEITVNIACVWHVAHKAALCTQPEFFTSHATACLSKLWGLIAAAPIAFPYVAFYFPNFKYLSLSCGVLQHRSKRWAKKLANKLYGMAAYVRSILLISGPEVLFKTCIAMKFVDDDDDDD